MSVREELATTTTLQQNNFRESSSPLIYQVQIGNSHSPPVRPDRPEMRQTDTKLALKRLADKLISAYQNLRPENSNGTALEAAIAQLPDATTGAGSFLSLYTTDEMVRLLIKPFLPETNYQRALLDYLPIDTIAIPPDFPIQQVEELAETRSNNLNHFWYELKLLGTRFLHPELSRQDERLADHGKELPVITVKPLSYIDELNVRLTSPSRKRSLIPNHITSNQNNIQPENLKLYAVSELLSAPEEHGICMEVEEGERVVIVSLKQQQPTQRYNAGVYRQVNIPEAALMLVYHRNRSVTIYIHSHNELEKISGTPIVDAWSVMEQDILQKITDFCYDCEFLEPLDVLSQLWSAKRTFAHQTNAATVLHELTHQLQEHTFFQHAENKALLQEMLDIVRGNSRGGLALTTTEQTLVRELVTPETEAVIARFPLDYRVLRKVVHKAKLRLERTAQRLARRFSPKLESRIKLSFRGRNYFDEPAKKEQQKLSLEHAQALMRTLTDRTKLLAFIEHCPEITPTTRGQFKSESRYVTTAGSLWSLSEAVVGAITDPITKATLHKRLVEYCYAVKANTTNTPSFMEFEKNVAELFNQATNQPLSQEFTEKNPLLLEFLYAKTTEDFSLVRERMIQQASKTIFNNAVATSSELYRERSYRWRAQQQIDTLSADPAQQILSIKCSMAEILGREIGAERMPALAHYLSARTQTADTPLVISMALNPIAHAQVWDSYRVLFGDASSVSQDRLVGLLSALQFANTLRSDSEATETHSAQLDRFFDLIKWAAFPTDHYSEVQDAINTNNVTLQEIKDFREHAKVLFAALSIQYRKEEPNYAEGTELEGDTALRTIFNHITRAGAADRQARISEIFAPEHRPAMRALLAQLIVEHTSSQHAATSTSAKHAVHQLLITQSSEIQYAQAQRFLEHAGIETNLALLLIHGWGGTGHVYDSIIRQLMDGLDPSVSALAIAPSLMHAEGSGFLWHHSGGKLVYGMHQSTYQDVSAGIEELQQLLGLPAVETVVSGHSMGGLLVLYLALFYNPNLWKKVRVVSLEPVSANNAEVINYVTFLQLMVSTPEHAAVLAESVKDAEIIQKIWKNQGLVNNQRIDIAALSTFLESADLKKQLNDLHVPPELQLTTHIKLIGRDKDGTRTENFAALMTYLTTHDKAFKSLTAEEVQDLMTWFGNIGINEYCLSTLVKNISKDISSVQGSELIVHRDTYHPYVTQILSNTRMLSAEELLYLSELPEGNIRILLGIADDVLKYQITVVKWRVLLKLMAFAKLDAHHYAHTTGDGIELFKAMVQDAHQSMHQSSTTV